MQIPHTPLKFIAGILTQPQAGSRSHIDPALPAKTDGQPRPSNRQTIAAGLAALGTAEALDQAVRALRAEGRLPRRGSLLDISA
ncbi:MAG TPA: hypothetical protein VGA60_13425 [Kiloniellales bacterium]|jgi:hypothetical protein